MLATLYNTVKQKDEWLALAAHGVDFIQKHCFDTDGRMFFSLTREGKPLRKRRYIFSEIFTIMAFAAYGKASGDGLLKNEALDLFKRVLSYLDTPGTLSPKTNPEVRPMKALAIPMCMIVAAQELRKALPDPMLNDVIDRARGRQCRLTQRSLPGASGWGTTNATPPRVRMCWSGPRSR